MFSPFSNETVTQTFLSAKFPYMTWSAKCGRQNKWLSSCYKSTDMDSTSHFPKLGHVQHYFSLPCMHVFFSQGMHACEGHMHLFSRICMRSVGVSLSSQWLNLMATVCVVWMDWDSSSWTVQLAKEGLMTFLPNQKLLKVLLFKM
jgi:hypothetical protein